MTESAWHRVIDHASGHALLILAALYAGWGVLLILDTIRAAVAGRRGR